MSQPESFYSPQPKPARGAYVVKRKADRAAIRTHEDAEKEKVRARDKKCRWPHCRHSRIRLEVAHMDPKGMGGDHGVRTWADRLVLLCYLHHQADPQEGHPEGSLDRGNLRIEPLTDLGANGPMAFYHEKVETTPTGIQQSWVLVGRERSVGVLMMVRSER